MFCAFVDLVQYSRMRFSSSETVYITIYIVCPRPCTRPMQHFNVQSQRVRESERQKEKGRGKREKEIESERAQNNGKL